MLAAFQRVKPAALRQSRTRRRANGAASPHWREVQHRQFQRRYRRELATNAKCPRCSGPISEAMLGCPWCGKELGTYRGKSQAPAQCARCHRGRKLDWRYCAWCYGEGFHQVSERSYADRRYTARCSGTRCTRRELMPWMRYCPWCRSRVRQRWKIPGAKEHCPSCGWGVVGEFWSHCPWCTKSLAEVRTR
jgi:hypothetical protein